MQLENEAVEMRLKPESTKAPKLDHKSTLQTD